MAVGSRFIGTGGYRSSAARRVGIRVLAWVVSPIAPEGHRPDLRLPAPNRRAIALFAADYPHDYPEVEATVMALRHRAAADRGAGRRCASASRAAPRSARSRSVYYMVKVLLALFVGLFRRNVTPMEDHDSARISIVAALASLLCSSSSSS